MAIIDTCTTDLALPLVQFKLFDNLCPTDLARLGQCLRPANVPARCTLFSPAQPSHAIYFLVQGAVKVCIEESSGRDVLLAICGDGEVLGEVSALDGLGHSASVITLEPSKFLLMDVNSFCEHLDMIPALGRNLSIVMAHRLRYATAQTRALSRLKIAGRVAHQLLHIARFYGQVAPTGAISLPHWVNQDDLAALVGATRESVNKTLASYQCKGFISLDKYRITLHDPQGLQQQL